MIDQSQEQRTKVFIESLTGIWRAWGELEQVVGRHSDDPIQEEASKLMKGLQDAIEAHLDNWNNGGYDLPHINECKENGTGYYPSKGLWSCPEPYGLYSEEYCPACVKHHRGIARGD